MIDAEDEFRTIHQDIQAAQRAVYDLDLGRASVTLAEYKVKLALGRANEKIQRLLRMKLSASPPSPSETESDLNRRLENGEDLSNLDPGMRVPNDADTTREPD